MRPRKTKTKNNKGFTLMEIIVATLLIGILVMIAIPNYNKVVFRAKVTSYAAAMLKRIAAAEQAYFSKHDYYSDINVATSTICDWEALGLDVPNDNRYNYGFQNTPTAIGVIVSLDSPGAYAFPYPFTSEAWGNPNYYQVGVTIDGKMGVQYSNGTFERWQ